MDLKIKFHLDTKVIVYDIEYPKQNQISFAIDPGDQKIKINKITLNGIETNIFYNTSFSIDNSDVVLTSVHEITRKGVYKLQLDDLYILSHRSNNWHCSEHKNDFLFHYEFTKDSFSNIYRDRESKGFDSDFIPCFGCSFTYGQGQPETNTWPSILSRETNRNFLNMGVCGIGIDGIYKNLTLLHKKHQFEQCVILLPTFSRRMVSCKIDGVYFTIPSSVNIEDATSDYQFYRNKKVISKMTKVKDSIAKDISDQYSKLFLTKIVNYCTKNKIKLLLSSWDDDVYDHLQRKRNILRLNQFPKLSLFKERANDGVHPTRKHYQLFVDQISSFL